MQMKNIFFSTKQVYWIKIRIYVLFTSMGIISEEQLYIKKNEENVFQLHGSIMTQVLILQ